MKRSRLKLRRRSLKRQGLRRRKVKNTFSGSVLGPIPAADPARLVLFTAVAGGVAAGTAGAAFLVRHLRRSVEPVLDSGAWEVGRDKTVYEEFRWGKELLESGNPAQAALRLEKARELEPRKTSIREALGRAYFEMGRLSEAESEFKAVVETNPTNDYAHFCLFRVLGKRGRHVEAGAHLRLAQAMNPESEIYGSSE